MVLSNFRAFGVAVALAAAVGMWGCAGTTKQKPAEETQGNIEEVLGLQQGQEESQAKSEDEVLKLLGISEEPAAQKEETTKEVVQKTDLEKLQEKVEELEKQLREKESQIASLKSDLAAKEKAISELEARARSIPSTGPVASGKPRQPSAEFRVRYQDALAEYNARNYKTAIRLFQDLLATDPNNTLSDNCQYWIGESYYGLEDYNQALVAFEKVFAFPETNKAPDAQLKIGLCYLRLGDRERARQELQRLLDNYPDSEYVAKARQLLSQL